MIRILDEIRILLDMSFKQANNKELNMARRLYELAQELFLSYDFTNDLQIKKSIVETANKCLDRIEKVEKQLKKVRVVEINNTGILRKYYDDFRIEQRNFFSTSGIFICSSVCRKHIERFVEKRVSFDTREEKGYKYAFNISLLKGIK